MKWIKTKQLKRELSPFESMNLVYFRVFVKVLISLISVQHCIHKTAVLSFFYISHFDSKYFIGHNQETLNVRKVFLPSIDIFLME